MIKRLTPRKRGGGRKAGNDYAVGYGKPPVNTRFKRGQSGNPKGRPKGSRNFKTEIHEALRARVVVTIGGKTRKISTLAASMLKLVKRGFDGDVRALRLLIDLAQTCNDEEQTLTAGTSDDDLQLLAVFEDRVRRNAAQSFGIGKAARVRLAPSGADPADGNASVPEKRASAQRVRSTRSKSAGG